jgi:hypothetical protein
VTVIGSGRGLSAFVTSGNARLLIVSGTDSAAFGNALAHARHPGFNRIDILIGGDATATTLLTAHAIDRVNPGYVIVAGDATGLLESGLHIDEATSRPRRIELTDMLSATLDVVDRPSQSDPALWKVVIVHGKTKILYISHPDALIALPEPGPVAALIIGRGKATSTMDLAEVGLVIADGESTSGPELRSVVGEALGRDVFTLRVHAGETSRLGFVDNGLDVPDNAQPADSSSAEV